MKKSEEGVFAINYKLYKYRVNTCRWLTNTPKYVTL